MAIGTPVTVFTNTADAISPVSSGSITPTSGDIVIACCTVEDTAANPTKATISDTAGWTWTEQQDVTYATGSNPRLRSTIWTATATGAANTITFTQGGNVLGCQICTVSGASATLTNFCSATDPNGDPSITFGSAFGSSSASAAYTYAAQANSLVAGSGMTTLVNLATMGSSGRVWWGYDLTSPASTQGWTSTNTFTIALGFEIQPAGGSTTPQSVNITATSSTSIAKQAGKIASIVGTTSTLFARSVGKIFAITGTSTTSVAALKVKLQSINITATSTTTLSRSVGKIVAAVGTTTTSLSRSVGKLVNIVSTTTTTVQKAVSKILAIVGTSATTVSAIKVKLQTVSITATSTVSLLRQSGKSIAITATSTTTLARAMSRTISIVGTSVVSLLKQVGKTLGITSTTTTTVSAFSGNVFPQSVSATCTTGVSVTAQFIQGNGGLDTHDGDEWSLRRWRDEANKARKRKQPAEPVAVSPPAASRVEPVASRSRGPVPQALVDAASPVGVAGPGVTWGEDDLDLQDIMELL